MEQQNQIKNMATMVTSIGCLIKQKLKGEGNLNPTSTGLNVSDEARPPIDLNVFNDARAHPEMIKYNSKHQT